MLPTVIISARGEERLRGGHPWIYRADVADVRAEGGDIVLVRTPRGRPLGRALYSSQSQIALRMLSLGEKPADEALIRQRILDLAARGVAVLIVSEDLGEMLETIASFHDEELARWVDWFTRLFEPILMALIGLAIGVIVVLMYMPIFELAGNLQ